MKILTEKQWMIICCKQLGLRSEDNPSEVKKCASYAMDMGLLWTEYRQIPPDWDEALMATLELMQSFSDSKGRYLMLVNNSCGNTTREYGKCFPKCSALPRYITSISLNNDIEKLHDWVLENIV